MIQFNRKNDNGCWKRKTALEKNLLVYSTLLTVLGLSFAIYFLITADYSSSSGGECTKKFCVKSAAEIFDFVDFKQDPCNDFYKFVCGSYYKNAVKRNTISPLVSIKNELDNEIKSIVIDPIRKKDSKAHVLLKQFYHACMDEEKIDEDSNQAFMTAVNELGGWPLLNGSSWDDSSFSWIDWHIRARKLGLPIVEFFTLKNVKTEGGDPVLQVTGVADDVIEYIGSSKYESVMREIITGLSNTSTFDQKENNEVYKFMKKLKELSFTSFSKMKVKTLKELQKECPAFPWLKFLNTIAQNETHFDSSSKVVYGYIGSYCQSLEKQIVAQNSRTLANFFVWSIIHRTYNYLDRTIREVYREIHYNIPSRYEICFKDADNMFKYVKETVYIRRRVSTEVKEDLTEMINLMKEVLIEHLKAGDWMDEHTKSLALKKAAQIEIMIGASDQLYDENYFDKVLGVYHFQFTDDNIFRMIQQKNAKTTQYFFQSLYDKQDEDWPSFFQNAIKPNAYFVPPLNVMILPAPILSSIFYDHRKPAFMNYGSIGRIIGHELMHGFEKNGRWVVFKDDYMINWWSNDTAVAYDNKVQCLIDMYEKINFRYKLNGSLTLDENVSDFAGIDIAYEAYLRYVEKHGPEVKLPGISLTPAQIYWVQTGTFLCFRKLDDNVIDYEEEDEHAIPAFRVEGGASNSLHFFKDFNCPVGSTMNPRNKCRIL